MLEKLTKKDILIFSILIFFTCLAWLSILDKAAYSMNIDSLKETSIAFGSIKLLESVISLANNIPFVGAILTPLNEFLGQISGIMLIALMSLGLQKVIIVVMQSFIINAILTISVLFFIVNKMNAIFPNDFTDKFLKFIFLLLFIRFAIPLMTFAVMSIESGVQKMQTEVSAERIQKLQDNIANINKLVQDDKNIEKEREQKITSLKSNIEILDNEKNQVKDEIKEIKKGDKSILERTTSMFEEQDPKTKEQIVKREERIEIINSEIKILKKEIDDADSLFNFGIKHKIDTALANIKSFMEEMFDVLITMVVLFFFKNVLFPILFIWGLAKLVDRAFNTSYENNLKKFRDDKILNKSIE